MPTQSEILQYKYYNEKEEFPKIIDLKEGSVPGETIAKAFLIDDRLNRNSWRVTNEGMKKYSTGFINKPLIAYKGWDHPNYLKEGVANDSKNFVQDVLEVGDRFKVGDIIDVRYEPHADNPNRKAWYAYIRMTDKEFTSKLKSGDVPFYVSPQVFDLNENPDYTDETGVEGTVKDFIPLHLAVVKEPAYGKVARIKGICDGTGPVCINALKSAQDELRNSSSSRGEMKMGQQDSSLFENSNSDSYKLTNKLYDESNGAAGSNLPPQNYNNQPNNSQSGNQQAPTAFSNTQSTNQSGNPISTRTTIETETEDGRKITRSEDLRSIKKNNNSSVPSPQQQTQPTPEISNTPSVANPNDPQVDVNVQAPSSQVQLPKEVLDALSVVKQYQQDKETTQKELEDLRKFKQSYEEERTKKAAEEQRGMIEGYFTEAVIADPTAREEMINFFTSLNLTNEQLSKVLDLVVSGGFQSASVDKDGKKVTRKHTVKSAALEDMTAGAIMNSVYNQRGYRPNSVFTEGLFGDINLENL